MLYTVIMAVSCPVYTASWLCSSCSRPLHLGQCSTFWLARDLHSPFLCTEPQGTVHESGFEQQVRVTCLLQVSLLEGCIAALPRSLCRRELCDLCWRTLLALLRGSLQMNNESHRLMKGPCDESVRLKLLPALMELA